MPSGERGGGRGRGQNSPLTSFPTSSSGSMREWMLRVWAVGISAVPRLHGAWSSGRPPCSQSFLLFEGTVLSSELFRPKVIKMTQTG